MEGVDGGPAVAMTGLQCGWVIVSASCCKATHNNIG